MKGTFLLKPAADDIPTFHTWESLRSSTVCTGPAEMSSLVQDAQDFGQELELDLDLKMNADVCPEKKKEYFCLL